MRRNIVKKILGKKDHSPAIISSIIAAPVVFFGSRRSRKTSYEDILDCISEQCPEVSENMRELLMETSFPLYRISEDVLVLVCRSRD